MLSVPSGAKNWAERSLLSACLCRTQLPPLLLLFRAPSFQRPRERQRKKPAWFLCLGGAGASTKGERMVKVSPLTRPLAWPFAHCREDLSVLVGGGGAGGRPLLLGGPSFCTHLKREPLGPPGREGPLCRGPTTRGCAEDFCREGRLDGIAPGLSWC